MIDLLDLQKHFILMHLKPGDIAADFTMGNGHDTEFLSKTVGENGHVYAFDIQSLALENTKKRLVDTACPENYTLLQVSHDLANQYIKTKIKAGVFNLGWLPGSKDKSITTMRKTTLPAIKNAIEMLDIDSILLIAVYPGHDEGDAEGKEVSEYLSTLSRKEYTIGMFKMLNSPASPYFMIVETR